MLSFSAEFPVSEKSGKEDFIKAIKIWLSGSPYNKISEDKIDSINNKSEEFIKHDNVEISYIDSDYNGTYACSFKHVTIDNKIKWTTEVSFFKSSISMCSVRTYRTANEILPSLPNSKKPHVVKCLIDSMEGGVDEIATVSSNYIKLNEIDINTAACIVNGESNCMLPIVYISCPFQNDDQLDHSYLAKMLAGLAHVFVEPNPSFSKKLRFKCGNLNPYNGSIAIYWPSKGIREFIRRNDFHNDKNIIFGIYNSIKTASLNKLPNFKCSWSNVEALRTKAKIDKLKDSSSDELNEFIDEFDKELRSKEETIRSLEAEIAKLQEQVRLNKFSKTSNLSISTKKEVSFFENEIEDVILDAVQHYLSNVFEGGRRYHIIADIIASNQKVGHAERKRSNLKEIMRDYKSMTSEKRASLEEIGLVISSSDNHHKLVYNDDSRYTFSLSKTSSDHRAGKNFASDISKAIF